MLLYQKNLAKNNLIISVAIYAELSATESDLDRIRNDLSSILKDTDCFRVEYDHITDTIHPASEKYPDGSAWVALYFKDSNLQNLAKLIDEYLIDKGISLTKEYVKALGLDPEIDLYSKIADHMNLCNYARVERAEEARKYVLKNAPKSFLIDTVALRNEVGEIVWEIKLKR